MHDSNRKRKRINYSKIRKIIKKGLVATKLAAIGTAITGAVTAISNSITTGFAIAAAGAATYATAKNIPSHEYDRTQHVSPLAGMHKTAAQYIQEDILEGKTLEEILAIPEPTFISKDGIVDRKPIKTGSNA